MTKKHFEQVAAAIKAQVTKAGTDQVVLTALKATVESLCNEFAELNPRFDRQRFFQACGL